MKKNRRGPGKKRGSEGGKGPKTQEKKPKAKVEEEKREPNNHPSTSRQEVGQEQHDMEEKNPKVKVEEEKREPNNHPSTPKKEVKHEQHDMEGKNPKVKVEEEKREPNNHPSTPKQEVKHEQHDMEMPERRNNPRDVQQQPRRGKFVSERQIIEEIGELAELGRPITLDIRNMKSTMKGILKDMKSVLNIFDGEPSANDDDDDSDIEVITDPELELDSGEENNLQELGNDGDMESGNSHPAVSTNPESEAEKNENTNLQESGNDGDMESGNSHAGVSTNPESEVEKNENTNLQLDEREESAENMEVQPGSSTGGDNNGSNISKITGVSSKRSLDQPSVPSRQIPSLKEMEEMCNGSRVFECQETKRPFVITHCYYPPFVPLPDVGFLLQQNNGTQNPSTSGGETPTQEPFDENELPPQFMDVSIVEDDLPPQFMDVSKVEDDLPPQFMDVSKLEDESPQENTNPNNELTSQNMDDSIVNYELPLKYKIRSSKGDYYQTENGILKYLRMLPEPPTGDEIQVFLKKLIEGIRWPGLNAPPISSSTTQPSEGESSKNNEEKESDISESDPPQITQDVEKQEDHQPSEGESSKNKEEKESDISKSDPPTQDEIQEDHQSEKCPKNEADSDLQDEGLLHSFILLPETEDVEEYERLTEGTGEDSLSRFLLQKPEDSEMEVPNMEKIPKKEAVEKERDDKKVDSLEDTSRNEDTETQASKETSNPNLKTENDEDSETEECSTPDDFVLLPEDDEFKVDVMDDVQEKKEIQDLLFHFSRNTFQAKDCDPICQAALQKCIDMVTLDYNIFLIGNLNGELCAHYPSQLIIMEEEKVAHKLPNNSSGSLKKNRNGTSHENDFDVSKLKDMFMKARSARCRARFPLPVIFFNGKNICRSSTLSGGPEIYGRSGYDYFFYGDETGSQEEEVHSKNQISQPGDWQLFDKVRKQDIRLLKTLNVGAIIDFMVEKKKVKFGVNVSSSEKVDKENRYNEFTIISLPYPGCEFFKEYRDNDYVADGLFFDWSQGHVDATIGIPNDTIASQLQIDWENYKVWELVELTKNYMKLALEYLIEKPVGTLIHCISGWDRTPLFISLLRMSLWADGAIHQSLSPGQILYFTIAYDWMLFGHNLADRLSKGEDIFIFCFHFLKYIMGDEFSVNSISNNSGNMHFSGIQHGDSLNSPTSTDYSENSLPGSPSLPSSHSSPSTCVNGNIDNGMESPMSSSSDLRCLNSPQESKGSNSSFSSPVAVPNKTNVRTRNESTSSLSTGRNDNSTLVDSTTTIIEDDCFAYNSPDDGLKRMERLTAVRNLFYNYYCTSVGFKLKDGSETRTLSDLFTNFIGKVGLKSTKRSNV